MAQPKKTLSLRNAGWLGMAIAALYIVPQMFGAGTGFYIGTGIFVAVVSIVMIWQGRSKERIT